MEKIPFHKKVTKSITSPEFIADTTKTKVGPAILYALIIVVICTTLSGIVSGLYFTRFVDEALEVFSDPSFPDFEFSGGEFSIDSNEPIIVEEGNEFIFIIDTTNTNNINNIITHDQGFLLTDSTLIMTMTGQDPNYIDLDLLSLYSFSKDTLVDSLTMTSQFGMVLYLIINLFGKLFSYGYRSLILLLLIFILKRMLTLNNLRGSQLYTMIFYSMTSGIILYELGSVIVQVAGNQLVSDFFITAGGVLLFYIPVSTVMSRALRILKIKDEIKKIKQD